MAAHIRLGYRGHGSYSDQNATIAFVDSSFIAFGLTDRQQGWERQRYVRIMGMPARSMNRSLSKTRVEEI